MIPYEAPTVSQILPNIMRDLLNYGGEVGSRNGRVKELLNTQIVITDPAQREVLSINRKANVFAQIAETVWVLSGRDDIEWLSAYLPRAGDYSDDGKTWRGAYGRRIRKWSRGTAIPPTSLHIDQLAYVVDLLREDPLSRRAVIAIYDPSVDTQPGKDIPCNDFLQFQSRGGALHLTVTVRSNDVMWGWSGINAFEWSTLQEIVASLLGISVGKLVFNIGSLHLYEQHWAKAEQITYENIKYRAVPFNPGRNITTLEGVDALIDKWFAWEAKCRAGVVSSLTPMGWPDPLFQSWAAAIAYFWTRDEAWLGGLSGTALAVAIARTPASVLSEAPQRSRSSAAGQGHNLQSHEGVGAFYEYVKNLHAVKHTSYGDSWKKRGEKMSILANMARKVDRLGVGDEFDSSVDTVVDLLVYALKYGCWLNGKDQGPENVNSVLADFLADTEEVSTRGEALDITFKDIADDFDYYADNLDGLSVENKRVFISELVTRLTPVARDLWHEGQHDGDDYRADLGQ